MQLRMRSASLIAIVFILAGGELLACGDKFLVESRGTRYQRPKNARAASVLIYGNPSSGRMQSFLERQGHHAVAVTTFDQLSAIVSSRRFDVIIAAADVAAKIQQMMADVPDAAVVVILDSAPKPAMLLNAIDKAVEEHDQALQKNRMRS